ncbi:SGNH/GDSL hydrolase family protein [Bifidobacterium tissieri]|uniref:SGNH/GDSL hydrolase family protein n=1 Tax=Bifidobacterium tissieri TaxID=1630162 RepID=A0A5M9ZRE4_9BIFI|nr:SGNH/GDSL hydrolase family protein [Bifidobacterium tissieri]KAA8830226.1 SGNH/GDSL hydrolase family protein [Bifidobacterium tissieri]KAA8833054.1 SGNH/GDSL hydrolase family protein [Bifidobacterium tissieri]
MTIAAAGISATSGHLLTRNWANTTINCLGDSTTWGDVGTGDGGPAISWPAHLQRLLGAGTVRNYGIKGSRIGVKADRDDSFIERYEAMERDADIVLVFGGVNDFNREVPLGEQGDTDVHTFHGAVDILLRGLVRMYPHGEIVVMTPCKTGGVSAKALPAFDTPNGLGLVEADYVQVLLATSHRYGIPVIDLFNDSGISPLLPEHKPHYMPDGLHYSPAGYERLARRIASQLLTLLAF